MRIRVPRSRLILHGQFSQLEFPRKTGWRGMMQPWGQRHGQLLQGANQARMRKGRGKKIREKRKGRGRLSSHT